MELVPLYREMSKRLHSIRFHPPVAFVYNPLEYAREPFERYLETYGAGSKKILFLGMNPGPFGMAQTGIPFGDPSMVEQFLRIEGHVDRPSLEHPKRPVLGFKHQRGEVSGQRLWGWVAKKFVQPQRFFRTFFVLNYCPLIFFDVDGRNLTPEKLKKIDREALQEICDETLREVVNVLKVKWVVGIGQWATRQAVRSLKTVPFSRSIKTTSVIHPSPANPLANRDWGKQVENELGRLGLL